MDLKKIQKIINLTFLKSIVWVFGYILGINIAFYLIPDFELVYISGDTLIGFLFGVLALVLFEIFLEKKAR